MAVISALNIHKSYYNGATVTPVLRDVNLQIERGECVFLAGPSGSGKTTLLSILGCILTPDQGQLKLLDQDVSQLSPRQRSRFRRENLGFVFQRFHLFHGLNAWENVQVSLKLLKKSHRSSKLDSQKLLDAVGLQDRANYQISQLSMGQRQRVALARALATDPDIILADEPTASLDAESGQTAMELLKTLCQDREKTVLVVTHDSRIYSFADRILLMREGQIQPADHAAHAPMCKELI